MSNVIKAYNIRYSEDKKTIDTNEKANEFQRMYFENLPNIQLTGDDANYEISDEIFENSEDEVCEPDTELSQTAEKDNSNEIDIKRFENEKRLFDEESERMISEANKKASEIIKDAQEKAKIIEEKAIKLSDMKSDEGYKAGYEKGIDAVEELKADLEKQINSNELDYQKQVQELEPAFVELTISLLKKLTGIVVDDRRDLILHIIHQSISNIESSNNYIIRVSKDDYDFVNSKKSELQFELKASAVIEIIEDPILQRAQCTIETDTRIIDCSLDVQLKNLTADLKLLSGIL